MSVRSALGDVDSMLPPLLGNKALRKMQVILDCGSGKMIIPGPGGIEVKMNPGSHVYELELSNSGHWICRCMPEAMMPCRLSKTCSSTCHAARAVPSLLQSAQRARWDAV